MAKIELTGIDGKQTKGEQAYDEFSAAQLTWQEPGFVYRWGDRDAKVLFTNKRRGWKICDLQRDFIAKGCPEDRLPCSDVHGSEIIFGENILMKMPITLYRDRYQRNVIDKIKARRRAHRDNALAVGEQVSRELRARGVKVPNNVIEVTGSDERERDFNSPYDVTARDGKGNVINKQWR